PVPRPPRPPRFPYTTLFRSRVARVMSRASARRSRWRRPSNSASSMSGAPPRLDELDDLIRRRARPEDTGHTHRLQLRHVGLGDEDRKSTRLNSSHEWTSYAV